MGVPSLSPAATISFQATFLKFPLWWASIFSSTKWKLFSSKAVLALSSSQVRRMGRDTGVKALRNVMPSAQQGLCTRAGAGSPLFVLQTVLQLCDPGLHLHHQALFAGPVGTFQVDNPAL